VEKKYGEFEVKGRLSREKRGQKEVRGEKKR
jgi:hypothetical protein